MLTRRALLFGAPRPSSGEDVLDLRYSEDGAAAVEYGLIAGLIGVVLVGAVNRVGRRKRRNMNCVKRAMKGREASRFCQRRGA
ncbi:MAG: Flp family type IVb pilin [Pseudomonadota bacterium]